MSEIKLCYFDVRGFAEVSRLLLALADQNYEDFRWSFEDWPKYKPDAPFGQGPYLVYKGTKIGQSAAIACFLAREFGFYGNTNLDAAVIDQVIHIYKDLIAVWQPLWHEQDETKKGELKKKLEEEEFPKYFKMFQKLLKDNGSNGYFVKDEITLADIYIFDLLDQISKAGLGYDPRTSMPELKAVYDNVASNPRIKEYIANRKETIH